MCLIACAWRADPRFELLVVANRDELHARESEAAAAQPDAPWIVGGRDARAGGSWLQFSTRRRFATVTNVRSGMPARGWPRSRGALVAGFVRGTMAAPRFAGALADTAPDYGPFNLLLWDGTALQVATNHPGHAHAALDPGIHVLSNGPFGVPWPKAERVRSGLCGWLAGTGRAAGPPDFAPLFALLQDRSLPDDQALPDTGVGLARERMLAPIFILDPVFGTRCSTVLALDREGRWCFEEHRFDPQGRLAGTTRLASTLGDEPR